MFLKKSVIGMVGVLFFASATTASALDFAGLAGPLLQIGISAFTKNMGGAGGEPHRICIKWVDVDKMKPPPPPCQVQSPNGMVGGICQPNKFCKATSLPGGGSPDAGGQGLQQMLQQLMQKLMQGDQKPPGGGAGEQAQQTGTSTASGSQYPPCQINPASNTVTSVPCIDSTGALVTNAAWAGGTGSTDTGTGGSGTAGSIADLLTGSLNSGSGSGGSSSSGDSASDLLQAITGQTQTQATSSAPNTQVSANAGTKLTPTNSAGDIVVNKEGVTAVAGTRDKDVEVTGFIGSNTTGLQQSQSATARLCESRPWATGFLSSIIAPSFFDGVCAWRGYNVGPGNVPVVTPVYLTPVARPAQTTTPKPTQTGEVTVQPASVDIWASPAAVPLGTRTSIFWKAEGGAVSCKVSGPSFTQSGLSGGSATVPISGSSTFTAVCLNAAGAEAARDSVTVTLSI